MTAPEVGPGAAACPRCGTPNPPSHRFCVECGQAIPASGAFEGERKQVTVLFADMKGSLGLLADRDPEDARRMLDPVLDLMMEAVRPYEGTVNQVLGDGIMAIFGAPVAHENHAVRATHAAPATARLLRAMDMERWLREAEGALAERS